MPSPSRRAASLSAAGLALALAALTLGFAACKGDRGPAGPAGTVTSAVPDQAAANLNIALTAARVTGGKVQVDYTLTDPAGAGVGSADDVTNSWTLAMLGTDADSGLPAWQSLITHPVTGAKGQTNQPTAETSSTATASTATSGTTENLGGGKYRYTFATPLPADASQSATYRVAVYGRRPIPNSSGLFDVTNGALDFVPTGGAPQPRELVAVAQCNACHTTLRAHGGFRRMTRLCVTCHTTQLVDPDTTDTGDPSQLNPLDFGRMIHRIHRGEALPTVVAANAAHDQTWAFHVIGFGNADNVYGGVVPNRNTATGQPSTVTTGVAFPRDIRGCTVCHTPAKDASGNVTEGAQANDWQTSVSRRTCQSCHDSSWFADASPPKYHVIHQQATNPTVAAGTFPTTPAGITPPGLVQTDDSQCKTCHSQTLMAQAHTSPFASDAFNPLTITIDSITVGTAPTSTGAGAGTVTWTIKDKNGPITDLSTLSTASINVTGPTVPDFSGSSTDNNILNVPIAATSSTTHVTTVTNATATSTPGQYTSPIPIPAGASGSWQAGIEARRVNASLTQSERKLGHITPTATFNEFAVNPVKPFAVAGGSAKVTPRRTVVAIERCNVCHETLSVHGGLRHNPQYCVMCHTPDNTDVARRTGADPASKAAASLDKLPERSIHLKPMIHSIHTGEDLEVQKPFVVNGNFFDEVRFPTSRANCTICHVPNSAGNPSYTIDSLLAAGPAGALPTRSFQIGPSPTTTTYPAGQYPYMTCGGDSSSTQLAGCTPIGPITVTCMACHDSPAAHAHAQAMTQTPLGAPETSSSAIETCAVCHAENRDLAVTRVHAQAASRNPE